MKNKYIRSLDGLRAIAVLAVIVYHFNSQWLPGGFLGVDVFFVLSGFLITRQLYNELQDTNRIKFSKFFKKRVNRLVPAMLFAIVGTLFMVLVFTPFIMPEFKKSALYGMLGLENWYQLAQNYDYFAQSVIPQPLKHFWSLAVEIQFYLLFPCVFLIIYRTSKGKRGQISRNLAIISLISSLLMFIIYKQTGNVSRVYYGTDTRLFGLIIGGIFGLNYDKLRKVIDKETKKLVTMLSVTMTIMLVIIFKLSSEEMRFLYYGGFYLFAWFIGMYIIVISSSKNSLHMVFANKLSKYIASRSYAMYLWHYPLTIFLINGFSNKHYIIVFLIVILISEYSYRVIEYPILKGEKRGMLSLTQYVILGILICILPFKIYSPLDANGMVASKNGETTASVLNKYQKTLENPLEQIEQIHNDFLHRKKSQTKIDNYQVIMVGDSIMDDVKEEAADVFPKLILDARVGLQFHEEAKLIGKYAKYNNENTILIFNTGSNGSLNTRDLDIVGKQFDKSHIFMINSAVHQPWSYESNEIVKKYADEHEQFKLLNWKPIGEQHPEYITGDQVHLTDEGERMYVNFIYREVIAEIRK